MMRMFLVCIRMPLFLFAALAVSILSLRAQTPAQPLGSEDEVQAHFAAAQKAQRYKDFATAEREYQSVIAIAPDFAEVHMNLGLVYQLQNRFPEAMIEFGRALKLKPTLTGANFFLGVDHCKEGEGAKAIPYLRAALKSSPNQPDIWLWLATAQELSRDLEGEVATLRQALELQPKDVDLLYLLGHAYERLGKQDVAHMEKVAPESFRKEQFLAESYAASNEWPSAVIHFQNALVASPNRAGLHVELGEVLLHAGKVAQASREFGQGLRLEPQNLRALVRRGETELIHGNVDATLSDWARALAVDQGQAERILGLRETGLGDSALEQLPGDARDKIGRLSVEFQNRNTPAARFALAFLASQSGDSRAIIEDTDTPATSVNAKKTSANSMNRCSEADLKRLLQAEQFSRLAPCSKSALTSQTPVELRLQTVAALLEAGQYEASHFALAGLPVTERDSIEASYWLARCYEKLATASYLRLYQADPGSYRLHQLRGDIEAARGDDRKAIEEYRAAIALKPSLPNLHYSLGHLLWKGLMVPEARAELEAELALNPHHTGALNDLGDTYLLEHQPEKALTYLNSALAGDVGNLEIHRDLGTAYSELGDYRKAEEQLKIAMSEDHDGSIHYKLARAYQALGEKENAAREFALSTVLNRESHDRLEKQTERLAEITNATQEP